MDLCCETLLATLCQEETDDNIVMMTAIFKLHQQHREALTECDSRNFTRLLAFTRHFFFFFFSRGIKFNAGNLNFLNLSTALLGRINEAMGEKL